MANKTIPIITDTEASKDPFEENADTIGVPQNVKIFERPVPPDTDDKEAAAKCRGLFVQLLKAMRDMRPGETPNPRLALNGFDQKSLGLINQTLGEGEVSIQVLEPENKAYDEIRIVETVFIGIWRVQYFLKNREVADEIEVGFIPACVGASARKHATKDFLSEDITFPEGAMNSPAIMAELKTVLAKRGPESETFTINLSHLPISQDDITLINKTLGTGSVFIVSKGFGNCQISSTLVRDVWRVQYYNNAINNLLILNTIVVTDLPLEAQASADDITDSTKRIGDYIAWLTESWQLSPLN